MPTLYGPHAESSKPKSRSLYRARLSSLPGYGVREEQVPAVVAPEPLQTKLGFIAFGLRFHDL